MFTLWPEPVILRPAHMNNFRRPQRPKRGTLDGIMATAKNSSSASSLNNFRRPQTNDTTQKRVGVDFKRGEGFHARPRNVVTNVPDTAREGVNSERHPRLQSTTTNTEPAPAKSKKRLFSRKKKDEPRSKWRIVAKRTALSLTVLIFLAGSYMGAKAFMNARKVLQGGGQAAALEANVDPTKLKGEGDGRINILLLGRGGDGHEGPDLTDTMLIASIDPIHKEAALVSIPRDLWVKSADSGSNMKINAVYANAKERSGSDAAGLEAVEKTVESVFGIPINYHGMIDFEGFRKAIDTVGGVDINVQEQVYDPTVAWENGWNPMVAAVGQQHFDGKRALLYVRSRHGSAGGDFSRGMRQREVMVGLKDKVLSAGTYSNPVKVTQLLDAFGSHISTNFSQGELMRLYSIVKDVGSDKVTSVGLTDPPHDYLTTDMIAGQSVVLPKAGAGNYGELQAYIRTTLRDAYLRQENANITVLNGTEVAGLATAKANELKSYGYNVGTIGDAPTKNYTKTTLVDLRNGEKKYTKNYLEKRLNVTTTTQLPAGIDPGTADFVIIVSQ